MPDVAHNASHQGYTSFWPMRIRLVLMCTLLPAHLEYLLFPIALREGNMLGAALIFYPILFAFVALRHMFGIQRNFERGVSSLDQILAQHPEVARLVEERSGQAADPRSKPPTVTSR